MIPMGQTFYFMLVTHYSIYWVNHENSYPNLNHLECNLDFSSIMNINMSRVIRKPQRERRGFPGGSSGKESTQIPSWWREDPLEEEMATHSREIPWIEEPGRLQFMGSQKSQI